MARVIDVLVVANGVAALVGFLWRRHRVERRRANLEHVRELEQENAEIDRSLERMRKGQS